MPHNVNFLEHLYDQSPIGYGQKSSSSCPAELSDTESGSYHGGRIRQGDPPPFLTDDEMRHWNKERAKKDSHNVSKYKKLGTGKFVRS